MTGQEPDILHYTITGASDYPMMMVMFALVGVLFGIIQALVALLVRSYHKTLMGKIDNNHIDVMDRIATQRKEDSEHCKECRQDHDENKASFKDAVIAEFEVLWKNVIACCKAAGVTPLTKKDIKLP